MISLKALVFYELAQLNGNFDIFSIFSLSSAQAAGLANTWWKMLLSMDSTNTYRFGSNGACFTPELGCCLFQKTRGQQRVKTQLLNKH